MADQWRQRAACRDYDPELFFPLPGDTPAELAALMVCQHCPVRQPCDQWATDLNVVDGIWGGVTEYKRRWQVRQARKAQAAAEPADEPPPAPQRVRRPVHWWSEDELDKLRRLHQAGHSDRYIAEALNRGEGAVKRKRQHMGLRRDHEGVTA